MTDFARRWTDAAATLDALTANDDIAQLGSAMDGALASLASQACDPRTLRRSGKDGKAAARLFAAALADGVEMLAAEGAAKAPIAGISNAIGSTGLMLSGGGKLGNYHIGVIRLLHGAGLLPRVVSGSSAGSIMAALIGTRTDRELAQLIGDDARELSSDGHTGEIDFDVTTLDQSKIAAIISRLVPDTTFAEARDWSGRDVNIVVAHLAEGKSGMILNADNAPDVLLREAVLASCAVPYVYKAVRLNRRNASGKLTPFADGEAWIDGSVHADLPAAFLRDHYGVRRLIASVVNPFELPLLTDPDFHGPLVHGIARTGIDFARAFWSVGLAAIIPFARHMPMTGRMVSLSKQVIDQRIQADVIIAPGKRFANPFDLLSATTHAQMSAFIAEGEAATEARMDLIEPALRIEAALASAYQSTAKRIAKVSTP